MLQFVQQVFLDGMNCGSSCHVRFSSCISLIPLALWTSNIEMRPVSSCARIGKWFAKLPAIVPWESGPGGFPQCHVAPFRIFCAFWNLEHDAFLDELRLLEQSLVVSGTCARELWNMSKWIVIGYRFHVPQICLEQNDFVRCLVWWSSSTLWCWSCMDEHSQSWSAWTERLMKKPHLLKRLQEDRTKVSYEEMKKIWKRPLMARGSLRHNRFPVIVNWQEQLAKQAKMAEAGAVWPAKENMSIRVGALGEYRTYATLHKHEQARLFKALLSYLTCLLTCEYEGQLSCSNDCIQAQGIQTSTQVQTWKVRTLHTPIPTKTDVVIIEAYSWKTALRN